jgi:hypothetical protein
MDAAICALALTHLPYLTEPIAELARVVRPGGQVVISDVHPVLTALLTQAAVFQRVDGNWAFVRNVVHWHAGYLDAFAQAKFVVRRCLDIPFGPEGVASLFGGTVSRGAIALETAKAAFEGLPAILIWHLLREE